MGEEKSKTLGTFNMTFYKKISISGKPSFDKRLNKYCRMKKITKTEHFNKLLQELLKVNGIKSFDELLKRSDAFNEDTFNDSLTGFLGTSNVSKLLIDTTEKRWENEGYH